MKHIGEEIKKKASGYFPQTVKLRRHFHQNPELSFQESGTSAFIKDFLSTNNISFIPGIGDWGIIATIKGSLGPGKRIALRTELDALPIKESTDNQFKSRKEGVMHACGHDAHMAMLLTSLLIINDMREEFRGEILFIFQPGEELLPGGAKLILEEGTLRRLKPDAIIAQHVYPELETGQLGYREGVYMASSDELYIDISGKGGHAALPGQSTDQVLIGANLVCRLKQRSNKLNGADPCVLGIGKFIAPGATNVIPGNVHIEGTIRTLDESTRERLHRIIEEECNLIATEFGVTVDAEIRKGYPVLKNDNDLAKHFVRVATSLWGNDNITRLDTRMSSEDFAYYSQEFPTLFYRLGVKARGSESKYLHTHDFNIDEEAMKTGVVTLTMIALDRINNI